MNKMLNYQVQVTKKNLTGFSELFYFNILCHFFKKRCFKRQSFPLVQCSCLGQVENEQEGDEDAENDEAEEAPPDDDVPGDEEDVGMDDTPADEDAMMDDMD